MIWTALVSAQFAVLQQQQDMLWEKSYRAASPEQRVLMLAEKERRQKEATEERRHRETLEAIRQQGEVFSRQIVYNSTPTPPSNLLPAVLIGSLVGSAFNSD